MSDEETIGPIIGIVLILVIIFFGGLFFFFDSSQLENIDSINPIELSGDEPTTEEIGSEDPTEQVIEETATATEAIFETRPEVQ